MNIDPQVSLEMGKFSEASFTLISYFSFIMWVNI